MLTEFGVEDDRQMSSTMKLNANFLRGNFDLSWHVHNRSRKIWRAWASA